jgi:hypothetical protein
VRAVWKWLTIVGLAAAPALVLGQSAAWVFGFREGMNTGGLVGAITFGGFAEGLVVIWLATLPTRSTRFERWVAKVTKSRVASWLTRKGPWPSLLVATALLGQEPVIIALVWLGVSPRKLVFPVLVENALYTMIYGVLVHQGLADWDKLMSL